MYLVLKQSLQNIFFKKKYVYALYFYRVMHTYLNRHWQNNKPYAKGYDIKA